MPLILFVAALSGAPDTVPAFDRYAVAATHVGKAAPPRLTDPLSRRYRSSLRAAARGAPNFAGHYVLAEIGCGAGCIRLAAIDRGSGRVAWFPATLSGWPLAVTEPLAFRRDSRLLVVQGMLDEQGPAATRRYLFDGVRFQPLAGPSAAVT